MKLLILDSWLITHRRISTESIQCPAQAQTKAQDCQFRSALRFASCRCTTHNSVGSTTDEPNHPQQKEGAEGTPAISTFFEKTDIPPQHVSQEIVAQSWFVTDVMHVATSCSSDCAGRNTATMSQDATTTTTVRRRSLRGKSQQGSKSNLLFISRIFVNLLKLYVLM
jgi:hypothetical protein